MISNHAVLIGRLTKDLEIRKTNSDKTVSSFRIAVNKPYNKEHDHPEADFFDCVAWGNTAEFISKYFHKGDKIALAGRLQTREWDDKDGKKVRVVELVVEDVEFVEKRSDSAPRAESSAPSKAAAKPAAKTRAQEIEEMEDTLPF